MKQTAAFGSYKQIADASETPKRKTSITHNSRADPTVPPTAAVQAHLHRQHIVAPWADRFANVELCWQAAVLAVPDKLQAAQQKASGRHSAKLQRTNQGSIS
jgi:hypothetical protein